MTPTSFGVFAAGSLPPSNAARPVEVAGWIIGMKVLDAAFLTLSLVIVCTLFFPGNPRVPNP